MKQALIKHIESLDLYSYTISKFEVEIKRFIAQIEGNYSEDKRIQFSDLPFLDCKLQTKKRNPKKFKDIIAFINRMHLQGLLTATVRESSSKVHYLVCGQYVGENTYCYARFLLQAAESKQEISA